MTSAAASALASAPAVVELAEASRWRAPEVTAVLAEHAAQLARDSGDLRTALLAEGWLAQGLASLGHGVAAVPRAVNALLEATREHQGAASDRLRVTLAGVARSLDDRSAGLVLLAPVLDAGGASPRLHADAHLEAVLCRDGGGDGAVPPVEVALAALRQVGGEHGELGLAAADAALAGQLRARRQLGDAVEHARAGLRRLFGEQPAGGPLQPVSPYLAATLGLELTLALLDQGQQDAALESARLVMRWDVQPGSLVPTARLQLALAQRVYQPAGARDEALAAVEWVARAVARRELPEIEVECHGLLAELRERGGELSEALAASRRGHTAYRALASAVERAVVLLVRAAGETSPEGRRDPVGQRAEVAASALAGQLAPPIPAVGHVMAAGPASAGTESGLASGTKPPWMTSAGPAWRPSVEAARHPGSVTPRGPGADSLTGASHGAGRSENNVYRLFEGGGRSGAAAASSEPKVPRGPGDSPLPTDPGDPRAPTGLGSLSDRDARSEAPAESDGSAGRGAHTSPAGLGGLAALGQPRAYDLRESLETTDPLLGRTMAGELDSMGRGGSAVGTNGALGPGGRAGSPDPLGGLGTPADPLGGPATSPDLLGTGPMSRFDHLSGSVAGPRGGADALSDSGPLAGDPLGGSSPSTGYDPLGGSDPLGGHRSELDPLSGGVPSSGYDPLSGSDPLSGPLPLTGYGTSSGSDVLSGGDPFSGRDVLSGADAPAGGPGSGADPLSGSDPLGGAGPTAGLGAVPGTGWQAAAERLTKPGRSIGGSLGGPVVPVGLSIAQLAVELLGMNTGTGQPPHLVLIDIATPDGSASGPEVAALTGRIASRVREQLSPEARLYLVEQDAIAIALPEVDPEAVTRWVRTVSNGLSQRWSELAAELPRAVFRIDVRALDRDRTIAEQLWDLRIGQGGQAPGGPDNSLGGRPPIDEQPLPTGRHLAGTVGPIPLGVDSEPNRIRAQPGSGGRRRRPDGGPGSASGGKAIGQLGTRRADTPSAGPAGGRLTSRHSDSASVVPSGRTAGFQEAGGMAPGAPPGAPPMRAGGYGRLIGTPIARLTTSADQPSAADAAGSPESGRIALADPPRPDYQFTGQELADHDLVDQDLADPGATLFGRCTANGSTANGSVADGSVADGSVAHGVGLPDLGVLRMPNGSVAPGSATLNGAPTNRTAVLGSAANSVAANNGAVVDGGVPPPSVRNGVGANGAILSGSAPHRLNGAGQAVNGAVPDGYVTNGARNGFLVNGVARNGSVTNGARDGLAVNGTGDGVARNGSVTNGGRNGYAVNGTANRPVINGVGPEAPANGTVSRAATSTGGTRDASNGTPVNGTPVNGTPVNGAAANGIAPPGASSRRGNGTAVNGAATQGTTNGARNHGATSAGHTASINGPSINGLSHNGASINGTATDGVAVRGGADADTGAGRRPAAADGGADTSADPMAGAAAEGADLSAGPADGDEAGQSRRSGRGSRRPRTPRGSAPDASTPVSELSFAELLAGALDAYRES